MDAVDFLKEWRRICRSNTTGCGYCYLRDACGRGNSIDEYSNDEIEYITSSVEQWAKEHPVKTRQSEFLKMFPNAKLNDAKVIFAPPCEVDELLYDNEKCRSKDCSKCRRDYWLQKME